MMKDDGSHSIKQAQPFRAAFRVLAAATSLTACTGVISDALPGGAPEERGVGSSPRNAGMTPTGQGPSSARGIEGPVATGAPLDALPSPESCAGAKPNAGLTPLRRLTREQFVNSARDLLAGTRIAPEALGADENLGPFAANLVGVVNDLLAQQYMEAAETLARSAASKLDGIIPCNRAALGDAACADQFIERFGLRVYRRPLTSEEKARYKTAYTTHAALGGYARGTRVVAQIMMQSPHYLYLLESGATPAPADVVVAAGPYTIASRLAFFLWNSTPDDALLSAAAADQLADPKGLGAQVDRLLRDPRSRDSLGTFHRQWLGIGQLAGVTKDPTVYPMFTPQLRAAMDAETNAFVDYVFRKGDARLSTLLTLPLSATTDPALLKHYGAQPPSADGVAAVPIAERGGLLTLGAFLTAHAGGNQSSPVRRGVVVVKNLLCLDLPDPPPDIDNVAPNPSKDSTTRERFIEHETVAVCAGCHKLIDGVGFGFENYDGVGRYRSLENGKPVDASGTMLVGGAQVEGPFVGAIALGKKLAASPALMTCAARQWLRYALGRLEAQADGCSLQAALSLFNASHSDLRQLLTGLAQSDAFRYRRTPP